MYRGLSLHISMMRCFLQLYNVNESRGTEEAISGLHVEKFPGTNRKLLVMVATPRFVL